VEKGEKLRAEAGLLPRVSEGAAARFAERLPMLLNLVNDKFAVEERLADDPSAGGHVDLIDDAHMHFGRMLRAIFEFGLYGDMVDEFRWYLATLSSRGLGEAYFRHMVEGWIIAIHATIEPEFSGQLTRPLRWLQRRLPDLYASGPGISPPLSPEGQVFLNILLEQSRRRAAEYVISLKDTGFAPVGLFSHVILPALGEIGMMWQRNEISVADEHMATEICRYVIYRVIDAMPLEPRRSHKILVACVPGEEHELGARVLADYLETRGWPVVFLGRSTPGGDLIGAIEGNRIDVAVLSVTMIANLPATRDLLAAIRRKAPHVKTMAGGRAALKAAAVLKACADAVVSDIEEAHSVCLDLVGGNA
jgi:methanogenic corrinoid protein MtbC1